MFAIAREEQTTLTYLHINRICQKCYEPKPTNGIPAKRYPMLKRNRIDLYDFELVQNYGRLQDEPFLIGEGHVIHVTEHYLPWLLIEINDQEMDLDHLHFLFEQVERRIKNTNAFCMAAHLVTSNHRLTTQLQVGGNKR